jgi:hypothetical protein
MFYCKAGHPIRGGLLFNLVRALVVSVLQGLDLLPTLAAENADKAADRVLLPACRFHDLGQRHTLRAFYHSDYFGLLVGARFGCVFLRPAAPRSLRRGLLRPSPLRPHGRRLWRNVGGQPPDRLEDSGDCRLAVCELLYRLQVVEGRHAREAVPGVNQTGRRAFRSEFGQLLCRRKRLRFVGSGPGPACATILFSASIVNVAMSLLCRS